MELVRLMIARLVLGVADCGLGEGDTLLAVGDAPYWHQPWKGRVIPTGMCAQRTAESYRAPEASINAEVRNAAREESAAAAAALIPHRRHHHNAFFSDTIRLKLKPSKPGADGHGEGEGAVSATQAADATLLLFGRTVGTRGSPLIELRNRLLGDVRVQALLRDRLADFWRRLRCDPQLQNARGVFDRIHSTFPTLFPSS